ncbi:MAG TPA: hypothetical protein VN694_09520 [Caulobacteraceae bacterium]|nr:hypothetical protein [Caulobacteraceae bacterium]
MTHARKAARNNRARAALLGLAAAGAALALAGCSSQVQAPTDTGVCYHLSAMQNGKPHFNVVAKSVPDMEHCAAQLEAMRVRFLGLGGNARDIVGAYQGNFLFLGDTGVFTAETYQGPRYPFLVRSGDQLVPVGSAPP